MELTPTQQHAYNTIMQKISDGDFPIIIEGSPGTGKTYIAKAIKENKTKLKISYYDTELTEESIWYKIISEDISSLYPKQKVFFKIMKYVILKLFGKKTNKTKQKLYDYLTLFDNFLSINKNRIFILDEINFCKKEFIEVLYHILHSEWVQRSFSNIKKAKLIIIYSKSYYTCESLDKISKESSCGVVKVNEYTLNDIEYLIPNKTLRKKILNNIDSLSRLSLRSNLTILLALIKYIEEDLNIVIKEEIEEALNKYLKNEDEVRNLLKTSAIPPNEVSVNEIRMLSKLMYKYESYHANGLIQKAISKNILTSTPDILISEKSVVQFIHNTYKDYFRPKDETEKQKFFLNYSIVLESVSPGDYKERAYSYKYASDLDRYNIYKALHILQKISTELDEEYLIDDNKYSDFIQKMKLAYGHFQNQESYKALLVLQEVDGLPLPDILNFEKDFLRCQIRMLSGDRSVFIKTICLINKYIEVIYTESKIEKEIYVRSHFLLYLANLYLGKNELVSLSENQIISNYEALSKNNDKYKYYIHSLHRRSLMIKSSEIAYLDSGKSVTYFTAKNTDKYILYRKELFYSLINHADNCRYLSRYKESYENISRAKSLYVRYNRRLPWITLYNNYAIIAYENQIISPYESINDYLSKIIENVDINETIESTYYIVYNNIACFYAINNNIEKALNEINKSLFIAKNAKNAIENHHYILLINKAVLLFMSGDNVGALEIMDNHKGFHTYNFSEKYHRRKHNILEEIIKDDKVFSTPQELNNYMANTYPCKGEVGKHFNQCLYLWNMQYWSK